MLCRSVSRVGDKPVETVSSIYWRSLVASTTSAHFDYALGFCPTSTLLCIATRSNFGSQAS